jgi:DNA-binding response OmpR family regulator
MDEAGRRVLLVDDEKDIVRTFTLFLERKGYVLDSAASGREAEAKLGEHAYDVVVFDYRLPDVSGVELSRRVSELSPGAVKVMLTGFRYPGNAVDSLGVDSLLLKPVDMNELLAVIEEKLRERAEPRETDEP